MSRIDVGAEALRRALPDTGFDDAWFVDAARVVLAAADVGQRPIHVKYSDEARSLRQHFGSWAVIDRAPSPEAASARAANIRRGRLVAFRPVTDWEARSRGRDIQVRFVGLP